MSQKIVVHDPRGYPPKVTGKRLAPRLSSLDGKVVFDVRTVFPAQSEMLAAAIRQAC